MEYWLKMAKALAPGQHDKIQCCATDHSMRIEHNSKEYRGFCFRCKRHVTEPIGVLSLAELSERREALNAVLDQKQIRLPADMSSDMPGYAAAWLLRAGIPLALAERYGIGYSKKLDRVVLPVYRDKELIAYTMRSTTEKPKYIERQKDETAVFFSDVRTILEPAAVQDYGLDIVVTEDILSSIRVGRIVPSAALLGTSVGPEKVGSLVHGTVQIKRGDQLPEPLAQSIGKEAGLRIGIWLDADKAGRTARKRLANRLTLYGHSVLLIRTDKDPKRYSNNEIRSILNDRRSSTQAGEEPEGVL